MSDPSVTETLVDHQAALQSQVNELNTQVMLLGVSCICLSIGLALLLWKLRSDVRLVG